MDDPKAQQARIYHEAAAVNDQEAHVSRELRDRLIRQLRIEDPVKWSYNHLAQEIGCSKSRIKQILETPGPR